MPGRRRQRSHSNRTLPCRAMARRLSMLTLALLLVLLSTPLQVNAVIDVVAQLYQLELEDQQHADRIVLTNLPTVLSQRLAEQALAWSALSGFLQRALLWDAGLVLTVDGELIQVHVPCGKTMAQIFLPRDVFDPSSCALEACHQSLHFAGTNCSIRAARRVAQCAIQDRVQTVSHSTLWSEDGDLAKAPDIRVYRYDGGNETDPAATDTSHAETTDDGDAINLRRIVSNSSLVDGKPYLFTINQAPTVLRKLSDCPSTALFTVPCTLRVDANAGDWCPPRRGGFVDLWLEGNAKGASPPVTASVLSMSTTTMAIVVFVLAVTLSCTVVWLYYSRLRRKKEMTRGAAQLYRASEIPTLSGKSEEVAPGSHGSHGSQGSGGGPPIVPLPTRTQSYYAEYSMRHTDLHDDLLECDMLHDAGRDSESAAAAPDELALLRSDRELMNKCIPYGYLRFVKLLARGANGEVWRAELDGGPVAIKSLLPEKRHDRGAVRVFAREIRLASCLEHPNIVRFIGFSWRRLSDLCSISEFMPRGDLSDLLHAKNSDQLSWTKDKMCIALDLAAALVYLHSLVPLIIHRDLKSHNVLLNDDLQAKLSDFGLSRERSFEETMTNGIGTLLWTAPEILRGEAYTEKADIFSYGIVLNELDTCLSPYSLNDEVAKQQLTSMQLMHLVTQGAITPIFRGDCPSSLEELARRCVAVSPADRPSAAQIVFTLRSHVLPLLIGVPAHSISSYSSR